jgi:phosphoglycerol transferase MdoB-like AlkP superfamily enzyme
MHRTEIVMQGRMETDRIMWFSMWFLASIATFGLAFFPMFYRLIDSRNKHFRRESDLEKQIAAFLRKQGKELPTTSDSFNEMNAKAWTAAIILVIPAFVITYLLSRDLSMHEKHQDMILTSVFPERMFMPQTIPIRKYVLITIGTLGVGIVYWLYKVTNMYNAHFKAQREIEKEIIKLMEEKRADESV